MDERFIDYLRQDIQRGFDGVHERLDAINGRLRANESAVKVLEDRGNRDDTARWGALAGAIIATLSGIYNYLYNYLFGAR